MTSVRPEAIQGPAWLLVAVVVVFATAGLAVIVGPRRAVFRGVFATVAMAAMLAIEGWIAYGAGERICSAGLPFLGARDQSGLGCRVPFGLGAVILAAMTLLALVTTAQRAWSSSLHLERARRWSETLVLVSLAPVLLILLLVLLAGGVVSSTVRSDPDRRRSGETRRG